MIFEDDIELIATGWIEDFSVDPYVVRQRNMDSWFKLDRLIFDHPEDALLVFERVAQKDLIDWTFEGIAVGPLRTFLMLHGNRYDDQLNSIRRRNNAFDRMHTMAVEGMGD